MAIIPIVGGHRWEGITGRPQGTIQGIFRTGWQRKWPVCVGSTFPLESEFFSLHLITSCHLYFPTGKCCLRQEGMAESDS